MIMGDIIKQFCRPLWVLLGLSLSAFAAEPIVQASLSSRHLVRGETALLELSLLQGRIEAIPSPPVIPDVKVSPGQQGRKLVGQGRVAYVFQYEIETFKEGIHVVPPVTFRVDGTQVSTAPLEFRVFNPDELKWANATFGGATFRYSAGFHTLNDSPYEGETTPVEMKLYIPRLPVVDWGIPEFERDGLTCWRFEPSESSGSAMILGRQYVVISYPSTMAASRSGPVSLGPANLRLMIREAGPFGQWDHKPIFLPIPKLEMVAKKLPEGAPEGFINAVGDFTLTATTNQKELRVGDPVTVDVVVSGTGNLDSIQAPRPKDTEGWKVYESPPQERGDERRNETGSVTFRQLIQPLSPTSIIPSFRLVYFNPKSKEYKVAETQPIALRVLPSLNGSTAAIAPAAPPAAVGMPVEKMSDILGLIQPDRVLMPSSKPLTDSILHLIAGIIAVGLLIRIFTLHFAPKLRKDPDTVAKRRALHELEHAAPSDHISFLRQTGRFIEQWLGHKVNEDSSLRAILEERDAICFRKEPAGGEKVERSRRQEILKLLRRSVGLWLALVWFGLAGEGKAAQNPSQIHAEAEAAYQSANYEEAMRLWLSAGPFDQLSADTLYDIGNACYRLGSPGHAALYYRRALQRDSSHAESQQNLRFLERKYGSLTITRANYHYTLSKLRLETWRDIVWSGGWMMLIGVLACFATRRGSPWRIPAICSIVLGPLVASVGALAWYYYPDDSRFAPNERQAVVIGEDVAIFSEASRTSPEVTSAPPGSLCEIVKERGDWLYVAFATRTRGWVPAASIEKLIPTTPQAPPKLEKPDADSRST
jgi:hypothetical protein